MASHHHHHDGGHPIATTSFCSCYYSACCTPPLPEALLHSVASHVHQHAPPQPHRYSPCSNSPHESFHHHPYQTPHHPPPPTHQPKQQEFQRGLYYQQQPQTEPTVSSLLRRIAALESTLRRQSYGNFAASNPLRDAAARTIQTHFRAFLVRRSRTLRQLKDLASLKSTLNALKAKALDNIHVNSQALSRRAMDLLLKLDFLQSSDPMIRDGKRSISRDIIRFMGLIDGVTVKRREVSSIALKSVGIGRSGNKSRVLYGGKKSAAADFGDISRDERVLLSRVPDDDDDDDDDDEDDEGEEEKEEEGIELENPRISISRKVDHSNNRNGGVVKRPGGAQAKVRKNVSFADNTIVLKVIPSTSESISSKDSSSSDGSGSIDDERELVDNLSREDDQISGLSRGSGNDGEEHTEDGYSLHISDGERSSRRNLRDKDGYEIIGHYQGENGEFGISAPLPVKMESRSDLMKKRGAVRSC